jgi:hypothetical protein
MRETDLHSEYHWIKRRFTRHQHRCKEQPIAKCPEGIRFTNTDTRHPPKLQRLRQDVYDQQVLLFRYSAQKTNLVVCHAPEKEETV